jgi:hypothetical protein
MLTLERQVCVTTLEHGNDKTRDEKMASYNVSLLVA